MARHKVPRYVSFVDSFPMNAAGKILKYKMREQAVIDLNLQEDASVETARHRCIGLSESHWTAQKLLCMLLDQKATVWYITS